MPATAALLHEDSHGGGGNGWWCGERRRREGVLGSWRAVEGGVSTSLATWRATNPHDAAERTDLPRLCFWSAPNFCLASGARRCTPACSMRKPLLSPASHELAPSRHRHHRLRASFVLSAASLASIAKPPGGERKFKDPRLAPSRSFTDYALQR